ncbi:hypothetical protein GQR58_006634 [Nymphon striatum]|nr:hypothetical protein GQR58_006634 [Nymphon striatum]
MPEQLINCVANVDFKEVAIAEIFLENHAKWHKSCHIKFARSKLQRAQKQIEVKQKREEEVSGEGRQSKRQSIGNPNQEALPPMSEIKEQYEVSSELFNELLTTNISELEDPAQLRELVTNVKKFLSDHTTKASKLIEKLTKNAEIEAAQEILSEKMTVKQETKQFISIINAAIREKGADSVSNIDTLSQMSLSFQDVCNIQPQTSHTKVVDYLSVHNVNSVEESHPRLSQPNPSPHHDVSPVHRLQPSFPYAQTPIYPKILDPASLHLLKQELLRPSNDPFYGDPTKYNLWATLLQHRIKNIDLDPLDIVAMLSANTKGEPHQLIQNYLAAGASDPEKALSKIWLALSRQYGSPLQICFSLRKKIESFPNIKPPNVKIEFIESKADELNNPNFEPLTYTEDKPRYTKAFHTNSDESGGKVFCLYHQYSGHTLLDCKTFSLLGV